MEQATWTQIKQAWDDWWKEREVFVRMEKVYFDAPSEPLYEKMVAQVLSTEGEKRENALALLSSSAELKNAYASQAVQEGDDVISEVRKTTTIALVGGPLLALMIGITFAISITRPLARGIALAETVAAGDLSVSYGEKTPRLYCATKGTRLDKERRCRAARQMRVDPSGSVCRSWSQTAGSCLD